jgi:hypothetical protein
MRRSEAACIRNIWPDFIYFSGVQPGCRVQARIVT